MSDAHAAFDLAPSPPHGRDAVLLVHGFASSPAEMRPVAARLAADGLFARAILLAGHGTSPEALEETPWEAWYDGVADAARTLAQDHDRVFAVGFSTGGALLLRLAALEPQRLAGLASLSAPVALTGFGRLYGVVEKLGLTKRLRFWPKPLRDIRDREARRAYPSYPKLPLRAVRGLDALLADVRARLPEVRVPLFVAHSRRDHTVSHKNARWILEGVSSPDREALWLRESFHVITVDRERSLVAEGVSKFFERLRSGTDTAPVIASAGAPTPRPAG
jgi:carboxylesterase